MTTRKNAPKTRGRPFKKGNPGRPKGARNRATVAVEALLDGEAETLTRKAIASALGGDMIAMRLCLDRICPPRKERPIQLALPSVGDLKGVAEAQVATVEAMASGDITPDEAVTVARVLDVRRRAIEISDIEDRLTELERKVKRG